MSFTYTGPSAAAAFVAGVFNNASGFAIDNDNASRNAYSLVADKINDLTGFENPLPDSEYDADADEEVVIPLESLLSRNDELGGALGSRAGVLDGLVKEVEDFFEEFFPDMQADVKRARGEMEEMLRLRNFAGGPERARLRFEVDTEKAHWGLEDKESGLMQKYAARGFSAPPGGLVHELGVMRKEMMRGLAEGKYAIDREEAEREAANLLKLLDLMASTRSQAIASFSSYLAQACTNRYDLAMDETRIEFAKQSALNDAVREYVDVTTQVRLARLRKDEGTYRGDKQAIDAASQAYERISRLGIDGAVQRAVVMGQIAASAYNVLRGRAALSGRERIIITPPP